MRFLVALLLNGLLVYAAAWLLSGVTVHSYLTAVFAGLFLALANAFVRPILTVLTFPITVLTLGLFLLVINALMLMLTGWIADKGDLGFHVEGFWPALWGGIVITLVTGFINILVDDDD